MVLQNYIGLAMLAMPGLVWVAYVIEDGDWKRTLVLFGICLGVIAWMAAGVYLLAKW